MASEVSICNQAISWLGGKPIISLNDGTTEANLCKANYEHLRDVVLEAKAWTFAIKRLQLARLSVDPVYGFSAAFAVPSDAITILQASVAASGISTTGPGSGSSDGNGDAQRTIWQREGETIVCNEEAMFARYTCRITDPTKFSPGFVQALAARIAREIALPLTHSQTLEDKMVNKYDNALADGGTFDGLQGRSNKIISNALTRVR